jgi:hypothetical protein
MQLREALDALVEGASVTRPMKDFGIGVVRVAVSD